MDKQIKFTVEARDSLHKLHIEAQKTIKRDLKKLSKGELEGKPLTEQLTGLNSLIVGNYRAIYNLEKETIIVLDVGHRKNVYDKVSKQ